MNSAVTFQLDSENMSKINLPRNKFFWKTCINLICWGFGAIVLSLIQLCAAAFLDEPQASQIAKVFANFDWSKLVDGRAYVTVLLGALASLGLVTLIVLKFAKRDPHDIDGIKKSLSFSAMFADEIASLNINFGSIFIVASYFNNTNTPVWLYIPIGLICYLFAWGCNQDTELPTFLASN